MNQSAFAVAAPIAALALLAFSPDRTPPPQEMPPEFLGPQYFQVYFPLNSGTLSPEAESVVAQTAKYAVNERVNSVTVIGHADTSEAQPVDLSERRARLTAQMLVDRGVDRKIIHVDWKGKTDLGVPTLDGTQEPLNRRVTIVVP